MSTSRLDETGLVPAHQSRHRSRQSNPMTWVICVFPVFLCGVEAEATLLFGCAAPPVRHVGVVSFPANSAAAVPRYVGSTRYRISAHRTGEIPPPARYAASGTQDRRRFRSEHRSGETRPGRRPDPSAWTALVAALLVLGLPGLLPFVCCSS